MAHKVNPIAFRLNISRKTNSEWFSINNYPLKLHYDLLINRFFNNISEQYKFLFEKCKIKEYLGILELRVFIHPYAFRWRRQLKTFRLFISAAKKILPILKDQIHNAPHIKIINLPRTVPKSHLKRVKFYLKRFKWKFIRVKKLFIRHLYIINTAIYRSSSILLAGMIAKGIGSRNKDQKIYIRFIKSLIAIIYRKGKKIFIVEGIRVKIRGKIHGRRRSRRSRRLKFAFGSIPYSRITANVNYNLRHVKTKYGVFSIRVWIYTAYPKKIKFKIKPKVYTNFFNFIIQKEIKIKKIKLKKFIAIKKFPKIKNINNIVMKRFYKIKNISFFYKIQKKLIKKYKLLNKKLKFSNNLHKLLIIYLNKLNLNNSYELLIIYLNKLNLNNSHELFKKNKLLIKLSFLINKEKFFLLVLEDIKDKIFNLKIFIKLENFNKKKIKKKLKY